jgi:hypothetical protein
MFDRTNVPADLSDELLAELNELIERFRNMKIDSIQLAGPRSGSWYRNLIQTYIQGHVRRVLMFIDAGHAELLAGRPLVTELCSRAIYESVACFCDFAEQLGPLLDADDVEKIDDFIRTRTFATRVPSFLKEDKTVNATNILTQIDKMNRHYADYRTAYDHLSDITHPNALGTVIYFGSLGENGNMLFSDATNSAGRARDSFVTAALMLLHFDLALQTLEPRLQKLAADTERS